MIFCLRIDSGNGIEPIPMSIVMYYEYGRELLCTWDPGADRMQKRNAFDWHPNHDRAKNIDPRVNNKELRE